MKFSEFVFSNILSKKSICETCVYYHENNNTCNVKKCSGCSEGYVDFLGKFNCKSYKVK